MRSPSVRPQPPVSSRGGVISGERDPRDFTFAFVGDFAIKTLSSPSQSLCPGAASAGVPIWFFCHDGSRRGLAQDAIAQTAHRRLPNFSTGQQTGFELVECFHSANRHAVVPGSLAQALARRRLSEQLLLFRRRVPRRCWDRAKLVVACTRCWHRPFGYFRHARTFVV